MISFFLNEITTSSFFEPQNSEKQRVMLYAFTHVSVCVRYNSHRLRIYRSTRFRVPPSR